ncbi:MAG: lipase family protein [Candidatus Heimdallarchaeota archaeon]|nr:lipase family protein [Candidatus Heimdallarchaeota archaeon]
MSYNHEIAKIAVDSSVIAYFDEQDAKVEFENNEFNYFKIVKDDNTGTLGYIVSKPKKLIIAFRGSDFPHMNDLNTYANDNDTKLNDDLENLNVNGIIDLFSKTYELIITEVQNIIDPFITLFRSTVASSKDFLTDINVKKIDIENDLSISQASNIKVHNGFYNSYMSVKSQIDNILNELKLEEYDEIIITGHSLGGALATICALDLVNNINNLKIHMYNFASPHVGNKDFVKLYNSKVNNSFRIHFTKGDWMNYANIVLWTLGYQPVNNEKDLGEGEHNRNVYKASI